MAANNGGGRAAGRGSCSDVTSFTLKVVAIVGMTANHAAYVFADHLPFPARCILFAVGGLTFPIMAFLLVEGYRHTSSVRRYALRLGVFALVAQVPYGLFLATNGNVLFTLIIGLCLMHLDDRLESRAAFWAACALGIVASAAFDWGIVGVAMILLFKVLDAGPRPQGAGAGAGRRMDGVVPAALLTPLGAVAAPVLLVVVADGLPMLGKLAEGVTSAGDWSALPSVLYPLVGCSLTIPLLAAYRGRRGKPMKWFFYAYYPLHILVLGVAKGLLFGEWGI